MNELHLNDQQISEKIYLIRGEKVMLDQDLAELYGVATTVLKQAVRRNIGRFPEDFMFELTQSEFEVLRSQIVTLNVGPQGCTRHLSICFTETVGSHLGAGVTSYTQNMDGGDQEMH